MDDRLSETISSYLPELIAIRHDIHKHPETAFEEHRTAALVADTLKKWGIDVVTGIAGTGVVGTLTGTKSGSRAIALRADMDALDIVEATKMPYASAVEGKMHACGHDGHTTMLLGAAHYLSEHRDFAGTVHFIFQPAEEKGGGGLCMIEDGLFQRFPCDAVYGLHNEPGLALGKFGIRSGSMLANVDTWTVVFKGTGGHGAVPHRATDPSVPLGHFLTGMQSIVGRSVPARETAVISAGYIAGGHPDSGNVIPSEITVHGTARSYDQAVRDILENRLSGLAKNLAAAYGCSASVLYERGYPALVNSVDQTAIAVRAAGSVTGEANVNSNFPPITAGEDFAYMLQHKPGAFMLMGNGVDADNRFHHVHTPHYDFNDEAIPFGIAYWVSLVSIELG